MALAGHVLFANCFRDADDTMRDRDCPSETVKNVRSILISSNPAILEIIRRSEALRPYLSIGLPFLSIAEYLVILGQNSSEY